MASSSSRRSGSSGPSKRGKPVYISTAARDRSRASTEPTEVSRAGAVGTPRPARDRKQPSEPKPRSGDGIAMAKRSERERRLSEQRLKSQIRIVGVVLAVVAVVASAVGIY